MLRAYEELLTTEEKTKLDRFRFESDRRNYLITRALIRTTLSRYTDVSPTDWHFTFNKHGRPEINEPKHARCLKFNLSHTKHLIVCIISQDKDVGVDVENCSRDNNLLKIADRYFSSTEIHELRQLSAKEQRERFFLYWTLKESYAKAKGIGLTMPLKYISFDVQSKITISFKSQPKEDPQQWQFTTTHLPPEYIVATCVRRQPGQDIRHILRETVPLIDDKRLQIPVGN